MLTYTTDTTWKRKSGQNGFEASLINADTYSREDWILTKISLFKFYIFIYIWYFLNFNAVSQSSVGSSIENECALLLHKSRPLPKSAKCCIIKIIIF